MIESENNITIFNWTTIDKEYFANVFKNFKAKKSIFPFENF